MIPRYTLPEMGALWSDEAKLRTWVEVEVLAVEAHAELGVVPAADLAAVREGTAPTPERVREIEATTNHDVIAFLTAFAETVPGDAHRWVHYGMTSSDLLDTALGLTLARACDLLDTRLETLVRSLATAAATHWDAIGPGRTHGVHAEPSTLGHVLAAQAFAVQRGRERLARARADVAVGSISGAVGTYANIDPSVERHVCDALGLGIEPVATQVVARDRHADLVGVLAVIAASIEQVGLEVRHRQRTEVAEAFEPFGRGQKGSSAMPHKRNPIMAERVCGLARIVRGHATAALENVALWHERDISHSSVERVILPDAFITVDYQASLATRIVDGLDVRPDRLRENLGRSFGLVSSSQVLLALVDQGMTRDDAYARVQAAAMRAWREERSFGDVLAEDGIEVDPAVLAPERFLARHGVVRERLDGLLAALG